MTSNISDYLNELYRNGGQNLGQSVMQWRKGLNSEVNWWNHWFTTKGRQWPDKYRERLSTHQIDSHLAKLLPLTGHCRILDVGSGPITPVGSYLENRDIELFAIDPLARRYQFMIENHGVSPPIRTQMGFAEDLSCRFEPDFFELVHCRNALDHAIEPMWGIIEMYMIAKPGGLVFLSHHHNEAEHANYDGLHQWNMNIENGDFVLWNKSRHVNVSSILSPFSATIQVELTERPNQTQKGITVRIRKGDALNIDALKYNKNLRAGLLEALIE